MTEESSSFDASTTNAGILSQMGSYERSAHELRELEDALRTREALIAGCRPQLLATQLFITKLRPLLEKITFQLRSNGPVWANLRLTARLLAGTDGDGSVSIAPLIRAMQGLTLDSSESRIIDDGDEYSDVDDGFVGEKDVREDEDNIDFEQKVIKGSQSQKSQSKDEQSDPSKKNNNGQIVEQVIACLVAVARSTDDLGEGARNHIHYLGQLLDQAAVGSEEAAASGDVLRREAEGDDENGENVDEEFATMGMKKKRFQKQLWFRFALQLPEARYRY